MASLEELQELQLKLLDKKLKSKKDDELSQLVELQSSLKGDQGKKEKVGFTEGLIRAGGQGLTFGFGDELEALYKSKVKGKSYEEELKNIRSKIDSFKETNPIAAYGTEIAASVPTALVGGLALKGAQGAAKLAQVGTKVAPKVSPVATGAVGGGIYGAGTGEDLESRTTGALGGAALGGAISKVADKILPKTSELAKKFLKNDIRLTAGQSVKGEGPLGDLLYGLEASSTSIPGVGASISQAKTLALSDFNKLAMMEALEPVLNKESKKFLQTKLKNVNGTEAYRVVDDFINSKYANELGNISLTGNTALTDLQDRFVNSVINSDIVDESSKDFVIGRINKLFTNKVRVNKTGEKFLSGKDLKYLQTEINKDITDFYKKGGSDRYIAETFKSMKDDLKDVIQTYNPESNLANINLAYAKLKPVGTAVEKASGNQGIFSTKQLLNAIKQSDISPTKSITKRGTDSMLPLAREGEEVFGSFVPDSGTASRLIAGASAVSPQLISRLLLPTFASRALYGGGRTATRALLNAPGFAAQTTAPAAGGLLGQNLVNTTANTMTGLLGGQ
jgi:hypothetical protein